MKTKVYKNDEYILTADFIRLGIENEEIIEEILQNTNFITFNRSNYREMLENPDYYLFAMLDEKGSLLASTAIHLNCNIQYYPLTDEIFKSQRLVRCFLSNCIYKNEIVGHIGAGYVPFKFRSKNNIAINVDYLLYEFQSEKYCVGLTSDGINFLYPKKELEHCEIMFKKRGFSKGGFEYDCFHPLYFAEKKAIKTFYQFKEI